ncbi:hypothetical protein BaRGS_00014408 [Batillaria attramentaria]|uniref:Uncharacterized protein n=1 Tax=Batillaria attramentaria TaxID=370345 RepID=A0ABD0L580_9CAEN
MPLTTDTTIVLTGEIRPNYRPEGNQGRTWTWSLDNIHDLRLDMEEWHLPLPQLLPDDDGWSGKRGKNRLCQSPGTEDKHQAEMAV